MEGLKPDDKTICNFRADNGKSLKKTFREFSRMCKELDLYGGEVLAEDSVKIRADNSLDNNYNETTVNNALERIDKKIEEYFKALEKGDQEGEEEFEPSREQIRAALDRLKERKDGYEGLKELLKTESEVSTVDREARLMRMGGEGRKLDVGYSVQTAADSKHHLIVDYEVTNCASDAGNLKSLTDKAMELMDVQEVTVLADAGYYASEDIAACEKSGITCLVPKPAPSGLKKEEGYNHKDFIYDREKDVYTCPCEKELKFICIRHHISGREYQVYANRSACKTCEKKEKCTKAKTREVVRLTCQDTLDVVDERTRKNKALYGKRKEIVEHIFGTIKAVWGYRQFLCRTMEKVGGEMAVTYMAYNLRRIFNIYKENMSRMVTVSG
jgi:hypothetical protein